MTIIHCLQEKVPGITGLVGFMFAAMSTRLEGIGALVALMVGLCTFIIIAPKAYDQVTAWCASIAAGCRRLRRHIWPSRRRDQ